MHFRQRTVLKPVSFSGVGVHSGKKVNLTIKPAPINHGIKFVRTDLPDKPSVSAHFNMVVDTSLATVIGCDGFIVSTIEHLMASFAGFSIDNAIVELDAYEVPIMDGSAGPFISYIKASGIKEQLAPRYFFVIKEPIELEEDGKFVGVYPASEFKITCTIYYDHPLIREQSYSIDVSDQVFEKEICRARTFGFIKEIEYLKKYGFARGGSLDNVIVIDEKDVLNKEGLRFPDEFVRHKILDCIGDFSLLGIPILGHVIVNKSGHSFNHAFLKKFFENKKSWETRMIHDINELPPFQPKSLAI
ncbi:MAG: UDP-3-O-acyl-N-acetylglucosamine deacetylase [Proteobacteria bacterium]|nr:UDP-3-O-acyl-N-acetylglucosamine deacetylase [Desulfobacteraceae bacterium]MBU3980045.1 UDP-3-O-acyl-N-acetylglucosamine deacetylase [Pseudomonadota bacterium]MBU4013128.1 UDP-3-O-acyl-N-acetylglucosamine deacetylase [Pseudomonadota bacterium]MBU4067426.1 UDP-3-O-acyl-N-acetylglucosamine deacetylase [Pseudomonadota bacterium]MBU4101233.1 UDP-3-O-acyl-N-acetylglucosamine deacetylase [Pseudomonadota bacterium]